jgi:hypothetical protein
MGAAAAGVAGAGVASPVPDAVAPFPPTAASVLRQPADSWAALLCRHCSAAAPPGCTPEQWEMKSERHAARMALFCWDVGVAGADSVLARSGSAGYFTGSAGFFV